ncbi:hypothetical protein GMLC_41810 [Geomonas limicola]|uniref:Uncharacterized protein n=2 Tax=Geomonas TaxID=2651583 RepID=A0A6V8MPT8_9BACT|nr:MULTISPECIES: hypothetical protein [Geomonas]GFO62011.1 hypothetical protein GMST_43360 [Geomonas silvestris]GFO70602.1 hypothetical protein GMLC_41810 [Geomonas limicola]
MEQANSQDMQSSEKQYRIINGVIQTSNDFRKPALKPGDIVTLDLVTARAFLASDAIEVLDGDEMLSDAGDLESQAAELENQAKGLRTQAANVRQDVARTKASAKKELLGL